MAWIRDAHHLTVALVVAFAAPAFGASAAPPVCNPKNTVIADVVALDQPFWLNRLGASQPGGMIFALWRDVVSKDGPQNELTAGGVMLRSSKRPRPIVLRANRGDCLEIRFTNLLAPAPVAPAGSTTAFPGQTATREAGLHALGLELLGSIRSDGSWVGKNAPSLVAPAAGPVPTAWSGKPWTPQITYRLFAAAEGAFLLYSSAATTENEPPLANGNPPGGGLGGQLSAGLFGAVNVQPAGAEWYRSQVTGADLALATRGKTPDGQPILRYDATYPKGSTWPDGTPIPDGTPVLRMWQATAAGRELVHTDLTSLITGPGGGDFPPDDPDPAFAPVAASPDRREPYREFTIHYHEIFTGVQAFPDFNGETLGQVLGNGADAFAINYGAPGIGAEILANRLGVGPMGRCAECKFEEFFLSAWTVGDPAMVVDVPANADCTYAQIQAGTPCGTYGSKVPASGGPYKMTPKVKATQVLYPDDPANVYHSYLNDHVKFRILHAGAFIAHVHHLHAHQWLHTPNDDQSTYLDSQLITPGTAYTLEIAYGGSGNLNKTVGDSIFHCHFYPHFAGGMWSLWRVHDVFEAGTELEGGIPRAGARALPDGEIAAGAPIPALVPVPTLPMAPMPAKVEVVAESVVENGVPTLVGYSAKVDPADLKAGKSPGYPFFVPGVAGHRAPHPPMDFARNEQHDAYDPTSRPLLDGGLPRHLVLDGTVAVEHHNQWDFTKTNGALVARELPEDGMPVEKVAMSFHSTPKPYLPTFFQDGRPGFYPVNGLPPEAGAPYANPGRDLDGNRVGEVRRYQGADIQTDVVFSKKGWHYPQQRHIVLWEDVAPTVKGERPPEPLFIRANSQTDIIEYWLTNLVPGYFELDDFEVRTPTDILGQHIHLVKFDVLASDGAANGFNYEDGTFSPDDVRDRIAGINEAGGLLSYDGQRRTKLAPRPAPSVFGTPPAGQDWTGAQTTIQRWYADPVLNNRGDDRTLRTVFTHDHFGPSTHQQAGLYAGLLVEPKGSTWRIPAFLTYDSAGKPTVHTDVPMATRRDGGPTSWQGDILTPDAKASYREFGFLFQDTSLAYDRGSRTAPGPYPSYQDADGSIPSTLAPWGWADCPHAINPLNISSFETSISDPCPTQGTTGPNAARPGIITGGPGSGTSTTNYRTESLPLRVSGWTNPADQGTDLAYAYASIPRKDGELNDQPAGPVPGTPWRYPGGFLGADAYDPYTPLLRAYQGDRVQIRFLAGAHVAGHFFTTDGLRWLFEPSSSTSGHVATQGMGLSEHFEALIDPLPVSAKNPKGFADYLYSTGAGQQDLIQGLWGLFRAYDGTHEVEGLPFLPNNPRKIKPPKFAACPEGAPLRELDVTAVTAANALRADTTKGTIVYNGRGANGAPTETIEQPDGVFYVRTGDLGADGRLKPGTPVEPLILRAGAGECLHVTLRNALDPDQLDRNGQPIFKTPLMEWTGNFSPGSSGAYTPNIIPLHPSAEVGLRPQLVSFDVSTSNAGNVGQNAFQTVAPGASRTFTWYAGIDGSPAELGTTGLRPADPLMQDPLGLFGALVVEPKRYAARRDANSYASATIFVPGRKPFREFVLFTQSDLQTIQPDGPAPTPALQYNGGLPWSKSGNTTTAVSFRAEPLAYRYPKGNTLGDIANQVADALVSSDPETPIFVASAKTPVRFRLAQINGTGDAENLLLHGHTWQEEPWRPGSRELGDNPLSEWFGVAPHGPDSNRNLLLQSAGGRGGVAGDYLYRSFFAAPNFPDGEWGLFRVLPHGKDSVGLGRFVPCPGGKGRTCLVGRNTVDPATGKFSPSNTFYAGADSSGRPLGSARVDPASGAWSFVLPNLDLVQVTAKSTLGATSTSVRPAEPVTAGAVTEPEPVPPAPALRFKRTVRRPSAIPPPAPETPK